MELLNRPLKACQTHVDWSKIYSGGGMVFNSKLNMVLTPPIAVVLVNKYDRHVG